MLTVEENYRSTIQNKGTFEMFYPSLRNKQDQVAMWFHYLCNASKCHLSFNKRWQVSHVQVFYKSSMLILIHSIHTLVISDKRFITKVLLLIVCSSPFLLICRFIWNFFIHVPVFKMDVFGPQASIGKDFIFTFYTSVPHSMCFWCLLEVPMCSCMLTRTE